MIINTTITGSAPSGFADAVATAVHYFENTLTNNVTVNLTFNWGTTSDTAIAQTRLGANIYEVDYTSWAAAMLANAQSAGATHDNLIAAQSLPATSPFPISKVLVPYQLATAIGLSFSGVSADPVTTDATITLNSSLAYTFDVNNRAVAGKYDAIGALEHEISEALGRIAGIDGFSNDTGQTSATLDSPYPLNFFRYSGGIALSSSYSSSFFSLDGHRMLMSMGESQSDLGDWASGITGDAVGYAQKGVASLFTAVDLQAMSAIGWHVASNATLYVTNNQDTFYASGATIEVRPSLTGLSFYGDINTVNLGAGAYADIFGNGNSVNLSGVSSHANIYGGSNNVIVNAASAAVWLASNGQNSPNPNTITFNVAGNLTLNDGATVTVNGLSPTITIWGHDTLVVNSTTSNLTINGWNSTVRLGGVASIYTLGGGNVIDVQDGAQISFSGPSAKTIHAGSNDTLTIVNGIGGDVVTVAGTNTQVNVGNPALYNTPEQIIFQAGGRISLVDGSLVQVSGDGVTAQLGANCDFSLAGGNAVVSVSGAGNSLHIGGNGQFAAQADTVTLGQGGTVTALDASHVDVFGSNAVIYAGASASLGVIGSGETVAVSGVNSAVWIGGNGQLAITANTLSFAQGGTAHVLDGSRVNVSGNGAVINVGNYDFVGAIGAGQMVNVIGLASSVWIGGNGQYGAADTISFAQGGTANVLDFSHVDVSGDNATVNIGANSSVGLIGSGEAAHVSGAGSAVWIGGNGQWATADTINFVAGGTANVLDFSRVDVSGDNVTVNVGAYATAGVIGSGEAVHVTGAGSAVWLGGNGYASSDTITFVAGGAVHLLDASRVDVSGDNVQIWLGANDLLGLSGHNETIFAGANMGHSGIWGFDGTDHLDIAKSAMIGLGSDDPWAWLLAHASVSGDTTTIAFGGGAELVLHGFALDSSMQGNFVFF